MTDQIRQLFRLRPGEARLVLTLGLLLLGNSVAQQISEITAISNFLTEGGVNGILVIWTVDGLLIILITGLQSLVIDRFDRVTLMRGLSIGLALVFTILRVMFTFRTPGWLNYSLLYLVAEQQWLVFPLVFWILANDIFSLAQTKRLFPLIASWGFIGRLLGIGISYVSPDLFIRLDIKPEEVLIINVLIYLLAYILMMAGLRQVKVRQTRQKRETMREALTEGWAFVREVRSFRYLTLSIVALILCETFIEFRFLVVSDGVFKGDPGRYQTFYSLYRLGLTVASIAVQGVLSSRIINGIGLKNTFLILPCAVLAGAMWMIALPSEIISSVGGVVLQKLPQYTVDESARKAFQGLVPEERRGRVSIFMDSYLYAGGAIIGCLVAGASVFVGVRLGSSSYFYVYLAAAVLAASFALWAILKMRTVYDRSLLNWRLKRRQRARSVLNTGIFMALSDEEN